MTNAKELGKRIKEQRERLGYTREEFAEKLGITPRFCYDIELGLKGISVDTLCGASQVLNLSTDYLLFGLDESASYPTIISLCKECPVDKLDYLEKMISYYLMAIKK